MIICESQEDLERAVAAASESQYEQLVPALRAAKSQAASFADLEKRAAETLKTSL
jgi:hypothetical protein